MTNFDILQGKLEPHPKYHWVVFTVQTKVESPAVILVYYRVYVERTTLQQYKQFWCIQS